MSVSKFGKLVLFAAGVALNAWPATAQSPNELISEIVTMSAFDKKEFRLDAEVKDCIYFSRRWDPLPDGTEMLVGVVSVDLRTAMVTVPIAFRPEVTAAVGGDVPDLFREGSLVVHFGSDADAEGALEISGTDAHPLVREEWVGRSRTQSYIKRGVTRPSPRGDGQTYVYRDSERLFISYDQAGGAAKLRRLEAALLTYQATQCRLSS